MATCATSYYWDFGDGSISSMAINNHQYADTGYYQVKCIVTNGTIYDTLIKQIYVSDIGYPKLTFNYTLSNDTLYGHVTSLLGPLGNVTWYFGDSFSSHQANVIHVYKDSVATYNLALILLNSCGRDFRDTVINVIKTTDIKDYKNNKEAIIIFPNPSADFITINLSTMQSITIYNLQGKKEYEIDDKNSIRSEIIDIRGLTDGIHIIKIKTKTNTFYSKIIKIN